jgi:hypothetical protein
MPDQRDERHEMMIDLILHQRPRLDQDLFQMGAQIWAILGYIPVDGGPFGIDSRAVISPRA